MHSVVLLQHGVGQSRAVSSLTVAPANARLNSFLSDAWANDTSVFVTDVPILAPMMIGRAVRIDKTANEEGIRGEWLAHSSGMNTIVLLVQILYARIVKTAQRGYKRSVVI